MTAAPPRAPQRIDLSVSDEATITEFLRRTYRARVQARGPHDVPWSLQVTGTDVGAFAAMTVVLPPEMTGTTAGHRDFVVTTRLGGHVEFTAGTHVERYGPGDVYVAVCPQGDRRFASRDSRVRSVSLSAALLDDAAVAAGSDPSTACRLTSSTPVAGGARQWRTVTRAVEALLIDPASAEAPLVMGPAGRLLAATALAIFSDTAGVLRTTALDAHPETLRRAIAYIDTNPDLDITMLDVATAAHVTVRAVQLAFRRHLDTTPGAYLRQVRLGHAHEDLRDALPGDGLTVARVAVDWGFANPSRFAQYYRAAYGRAPSETLRN